MFVQVIQGRTSDVDGLRSQMDRWRDEVAPGAEGFLGATAGVTDDGDFVALARFESEEAASKNSEREEQSTWWEQTARHFEEEPALRDFTEVEVLGEPADTAGFVQVVLGRSADRGSQRAVEEELMPQLHELRTELLGVIRAWDGDFFAVAAYFASEHTAREGEGMVFPEEMQETFNQRLELMEDVTYYDLKDPWLLTP